MKERGVYPYDFMDSFEKFEKQQPPYKDSFYSLLMDDGISEEQYQHAQKVWNTFNQKNMGQYHDLCLRISEKHACSTTNWIPVIILHLLA